MVFFSINTTHGMNNEEKLYPSPAWTRAQVERALTAFGILPESIKIYVGEDFGCAGLANSDTKEIAINNNMSAIKIINTSFHEAAHIKDEARTKSKSHANYLTYTAITAYLSIIPKLFDSSHKIMRPKFAFPFAYCTSLGYGLLGNYFGEWFHTNAAVQWAIEQSEYRADKMAVEKFIELNELEPIASKLIEKNILKKENGNQRTGGHPPARAEYKAMKKTLERNGYEVLKYSPHDAHDDLRIEVIKNDEGVFAQSVNFYLKV
ncbi:hypothetical protein BH09DEP1_BH09DEP1_5220 [soil metagenome]